MGLGVREQVGSGVGCQGTSQVVGLAVREPVR